MRIERRKGEGPDLFAMRAFAMMFEEMNINQCRAAVKWMLEHVQKKELEMHILRQQERTK